MRITKTFLFIFLFFILFNVLIFSQFHVKTKVELNIHLQDGCTVLPNKIFLVGSNEETRDKVYGMKTEIGRTKYTYYNVNPGKYYLSFSGSINNERKGVFAQYCVRSLYDEVRADFYHEYYIPNEIEVRHNRNLKIDFVFKLDSLGLGFAIEKEIEYPDFDYMKVAYYSKIEDDTYSNIQNNPTYYLSDNISKNGSAINAYSDSNSNSTVSCDTFEICGDDGGQCEVVINHPCTIDSGNIKIKINTAKFMNEGTEVVPAGDIVGTKDSQNRWTGGITIVTYALPVCTETGNQIDCDAIKVSYSCNQTKKKCELIFEYDIEVRMKIKVWNPVEMCSTIGNIGMGGNNYNLDIPSPELNKNCCWFFKSNKYHEFWHCKQWIMASEKMKEGLCNRFDNLKADKCCEKDEECKGQADTLKMIIFGGIADHMNEIFQKPGAGDYQEDQCFVKQRQYFLQHVNNPNCKFDDE